MGRRETEGKDKNQLNNEKRVHSEREKKKQTNHCASGEKIGTKERSPEVSDSFR